MDNAFQAAQAMNIKMKYLKNAYYAINLVMDVKVCIQLIVYSVLKDILFRKIRVS
jgi:hypothetical protein